MTVVVCHRHRDRRPTACGMLVGCLFGGPAGFGQKTWSTPEWEPGRTDLSGIMVGQKHYQGCVVSPDDGNVYAIAGHNHMSVVRIDGLKELRRLGGASCCWTREDRGQTAVGFFRLTAAREGIFRRVGY